MATKKQQLKSDHPFTAKQLTALNKELEKLTDVEIIPMRGTDIPQTKPDIIDIEIKHSPYIADVFLEFTDITNPEHPKYETYKIGADGKVDYFVKRNMKFNSLPDKVSFFNSLMPIKFTRK